MRRRRTQEGATVPGCGREAVADIRHYPVVQTPAHAKNNEKKYAEKQIVIVSRIKRETLCRHESTTARRILTTV